MDSNKMKDRRAFLKEAAVAGASVPLSAYMPGEARQENNPSDSSSTMPPTSQNPSELKPVTYASVSPFASAVECNEGHELILQAIAANGVKKMFFCGGTDNFYFMESVAKFKALGRPTPELITVLHESDAVYMNMGYFQYTGQHK